jgi:hypothetical protein
MVDLVAKLKDETDREAEGAYLLKQTSLLNDIGNGFHTNAFRLIDVLEGI